MTVETQSAAAAATVASAHDAAASSPSSSDSDVAGKVSSSVEVTSPPSQPPPPQEEEEEHGGYRCEACLRVLDLDEDAAAHRAGHDAEEKEAELRKRLQRPEDFEDAVTRRPPTDKAAASEEDVVLLKSKKSGMKRKRSKTPSFRSVQHDSVNGSARGRRKKKRLKLLRAEESGESPSPPSSSSSRPERTCKTTTNTLVALSLADERLDLRFEEEDDEDDRPLKTKKGRSSPASSSKSAPSPPATTAGGPRDGKADDGVGVDDSRSVQTCSTKGDQPSAAEPSVEKEDEDAIMSGQTDDDGDETPAVAVPSPAKRGRGRPRLSEEQRRERRLRLQQQKLQQQHRLGDLVHSPIEEAPEQLNLQARPEEQKQQQPTAATPTPSPSSPVVAGVSGSAASSPSAAPVNLECAGVAGRGRRKGQKQPKGKKRKKKFLLCKKKKSKNPCLAPAKKKLLRLQLQEEGQEGQQGAQVQQQDEKVERRGRPRKYPPPSSPAKPPSASAVTTTKASASTSSSSTLSLPTKKKAKKAARPTVLSAPLVEILPDLSPFPPSCRRAGMVVTKRAISEGERAAEIAAMVVAPEKAFRCLACGADFAHYGQLKRAHRCPVQQQQSNEKCATTDVFSKVSTESRSSSVEEGRYPACSAEYSSLVSSAIRAVPETTFNQLHGSLCHVGSRDAVAFRADGGEEALSEVDKVKLNFSGRWSTEDVWETGGWELGRNPLSWHKYESAWSESRGFLQRVSSLHWSQQRSLKEVYDASLAQAASKAGSKRKRLVSSGSDYDKEGGRATSSSSDKKRQLPISLGLKQVGRSVKYMTQAERVKFGKARKKIEEKERRASETVVVGQFNGEWERGHDFTCTVCCMGYDELREALHHKWDAHPFCLVAHVTLRHSVQLPPGDLLHPQLGRQLVGVANETEGEGASTECKKCGEKVPEGEEGGGTAAYHAHLLVCGGQVNWNQAAGGKSKKKKKGKGGSGGSRTPMDPDKAAEVRKARFARFERPPPTFAETGRMTRRQAVVIQEEIKSKKKGKKKGKRGRKPGQKNEAKSSAATTPSKKSTSKKAASPLVPRPRRSMVNYSRDISLREGWDLNKPTPFSKDPLVDEILKEDEVGAGAVNAEKKEVASPQVVGTPHATPGKSTGRRRASVHGPVVQHSPARRTTGAVGARKSSLDSATASKSVAVNGVRLNKQEGKTKKEETTTASNVAAADTKEDSADAARDSGGKKIKSAKPQKRQAAKSKARRKLSLDSKMAEEEESACRKRQSRLSLDSRVRDAVVEEEEEDRSLKSLKRRRSTSRSPKKQLAMEVTADVMPVAADDSKPRSPPQAEEESVAGAVTRPDPKRPKKNLESKPSERGSGAGAMDESEESDSSSSTASSSAASSCSTEGGRVVASAGRPARRSRGGHHPHHSTVAASVVFPVEVKAYAVGRIAAGEGLSRVARDLQCSISTLSSWWQKKDALLAEAEAVASSTEVEPKKQLSTEDKEVKYPMVPYERNTLLLTMRLRVEEAFRNGDEDGKEGQKEEVVQDKKADDEKAPPPPVVASAEEEPVGFDAVEAENGLSAAAVEAQDVPRAASNSSLALIASSYQDDDDEDDEDAS